MSCIPFYLQERLWTKKTRLVIRLLERVGIEFLRPKGTIVELAGILAKVTEKLIGNFIAAIELEDNFSDGFFRRLEFFFHFLLVVLVCAVSFLDRNNL